MNERDGYGNGKAENRFDFPVKTCVVCFRIPTLYRALDRQSVWILNRTAQEATNFACVCLVESADGSLRLQNDSR